MTLEKELLRNSIDSLTDEQAHALLHWLDRMKSKAPGSTTLRNIANDPGIKIPSQTKFRDVTPIKVKGIPISELLIKDRR
ncbi:MAG: hypothetical protein HY327_06005 [Chloroflexi bacterium]|nr:hypothetical protein [Chloroflexota bacterium]